MVKKTASRRDPLGPALKALATELVALAKGNAAFDAAELERRSKALASLSKTAELLSALLTQKRRDGERPLSQSAMEDRAKEVRDEIERRLGRLRAAQAAAPDPERIGSGKAGNPTA